MCRQIYCGLMITGQLVELDAIRPWKIGWSLREMRLTRRCLNQCSTVILGRCRLARITLEFYRPSLRQLGSDAPDLGGVAQVARRLTLDRDGDVDRPTWGCLCGKGNSMCFFGRRLESGGSWWVLASSQRGEHWLIRVRSRLCSSGVI